MPTPHLPAEIHNIISSHLAHEDLQTYRHANKRLADIGARYLFRSPTFHASYASLARIKNIASHGTLREAVESVTWDTSSFSLDAWDFSDWQARIRVLRRCELIELRSTWEGKLQDSNAVEKFMQRYLWEQYERYVRLVAEEREVQDKCLADISSLLAPFPRLKTIVVGKKEYDTPDTGPEDSHLRSTELVHRGMLPRHGRVPYRHSTDMLPFLSALTAAQISPYRIKAQTLNPSIFAQDPYTEHLHPLNLSLITHLHLRFSLGDPAAEQMDNGISIMNCRTVLQRGYLKAFLTKLSSLESLSLDFGARSRGNGRAAVDLANVFEEDYIWPRLRELEILHADTPAVTMENVLSKHGRSLRRLGLGDVCFDPPASWDALLTALQPRLELEHAEFSYFLFDARVENFVRGRSALVGWYVDREACVELGKSELGERLGAWMVRGREGDVCPLWEERKVARVVGRLEEGGVEDWVEGRNVSVVS